MTANGEIDPVTFDELERLARSHPKSGRETFPPCPPGWYPPDQAEAGFEELDRAYLDEYPEVRQRMWENWCRSK